LKEAYYRGGKVHKATRWLCRRRESHKRKGGDKKERSYFGSLALGSQHANKPVE